MYFSITLHVKQALDIWGPSLPNMKGKTLNHNAELQEEIAKLND